MMQDVQVKLNPGLPMAKATFNKNTFFLPEKCTYIYGEKIVKCYIWGMARYGAGT
jgi:hypothetical protein